MELTKNTGLTTVLLTAALLLAGRIMLQAQEPQAGIPGQLGAEIQIIEQRLAAGIPLGERHDALVRLAKLRQLSGNLGNAATHWLDAAAADPRDAAALVAGAYCLIAIGEWERASLAIHPLLEANVMGPPMLQAHYLDACLKAWMSKDSSVLTALAAKPEFATLRPMIYYTLWQITLQNSGASASESADSWKTRLLNEYPKSPEARSADPASQKDALVVNTVQSPLWLLIPGVIVSKPVEPVKQAVPIQAAPSPSNTGKSLPAVVLQTGVFGREANAQAQAAALRKAGYIPTITRKLVNGSELWAVTVSVNQNENKAIADLKKAGFESFPIK